ncbi:MAG: DUF6526 family protein [Candidatus Acidiferrum sp.]
MTEQNYSNHVRWVPAYHFFVLPVFILNFGWSIFRLIRPGFSWDGVVHLLTAAALFVFAINARVFALAVQDRVIRMEERQRLAKLLPEDLRPRIGEFTKSQLVALRFASDEELPVLARKVLNDKVTDIKGIKQMVKNWRADYMRA